MAPVSRRGRPRRHAQRALWAAIFLVTVVGCRKEPVSTTSNAAPQLSNPTASSRDKPSPTYPAPRFSNVADSAGIDFHYYDDAVPNRFFLPEIMGGGAAWIDFDNDGRIDLYLTNGRPLDPAAGAATDYVNRLYRNRGQGQFTDVAFPSHSGDPGYGQGCAVGDFDADGFPDLYLTNYGDDVLLHNCGDGTFRDVTAAARVSDPDWSTGAAWLDADADGDLDLYVVNYMDVTLENSRVCTNAGVAAYCGPGEYGAVPDRLYLNQGDGSFLEAAEAWGLTAPNGKGLAVAALDFDGDLAPEIYVANDMTANYLFTRTSASSVREPGLAPKYREIASPAGCAVSENGENEASMGIACADFDGDSLTDVFLTHYHQQKSTLYRNLGGLAFSDESRGSRIAALTFSTLGFGTVPLDYDRDGAADLFFANGHVLGPNYKPSAMRPQLLRNNGGGKFEDLSDQAGDYFQQEWLGRGVAGGDFDDDGDCDLAVSHLTRPAALLRNDTPADSHFLGLDLRPLARNGAVGGRVVVTVMDRSWTRAVVAGGSYLSSHDPRLLFGLGKRDGEARVEVYWPSGHVDRFERLATDRYWVLMEGKSPQPWFHSGE